MACPCSLLAGLSSGSNCRTVLETVGVWGQAVAEHGPHYCSYLVADKYCPLLIKEGGMPLLRDLIKMVTARQETKEMAR